MKIQLKIILVFVLCIISSCVNGAEFKEGIVNLNFQLDDSTAVQIVVQTGMIDSNYPYKQAFMWGSDFESADSVIMPKEVVSSIDVRIGNEKVFVPLSAYSNLGTPRKVSLVKIGQGFELNIFGSGTSLGYKATLRFNKEHIVSRKVFSRNFPDNRWEETIYSFISSDSEL